MRAARGVLNWSVRDLSLATGIGTATINRYEIVPGVPPSRKGYLEKIRNAFQENGVQFVETDDGLFGIVFRVKKRAENAADRREVRSMQNEYTDV
jgi:hypothetical protein